MDHENALAPLGDVRTGDVDIYYIIQWAIA